MKAGAIFPKNPMKKHFDNEITDTSLSWAIKELSIAEEAAFYGLYVIRTNVTAESLSSAETVLTHKKNVRSRRCIP